MDFIEELRWRGMLHDMTPGMEDLFGDKPIRAYIGFDPTAPSLTIGNLVPIMILKHLQDAGHQPIVLMGGATGRVGDPSGKSEERQLLRYDVLDKNLEFQKEQIKRLLRFDDSDTSAIIVNNYDFYQNMNVMDFLRDVGKRITVNYMMAKESVKKRIDTGISFTEFTYQLIQGYDFQVLYEKMDCKIQMGGSDQWGNITSGVELIRRNLGGKAYALTCPLLTKADGKKFGKSDKGNVWLDPTLTSPYQFFQFWMNAADADLPKYLRTFSLKSKAEIEALEAEHAEAPHLRVAQKALAEELTIRIHSEAEYQSVLKVSEILFNKKANKETLEAMSAAELKTVAGEIPSFKVSKSDLEQGIGIIDLIAGGIVQSKSDARRAIKSNAIAVNKEKIKSMNDVINTDLLLHDTYLMVENGKKKKFILIAE